MPGTIACDSTEVFQEGLRLPWLKLVRPGRAGRAVFEIIRANVRVPHELLGDLASQVAACTSATAACRSSRRRYERLETLMDGLLDHTERLLRAEIASWPDGVAEFTDFIGSDGIDVCDVPITVRLTSRATS